MLPLNLLQDDWRQSHQAFHIFSYNHANAEVQAFCQAYLGAVLATGNKYHQLNKFVKITRKRTRKKIF